jgi:hypothetical protein
LDRAIGSTGPTTCEVAATTPPTATAFGHLTTERRGDLCASESNNDSWPVQHLITVLSITSADRLLPLRSDSPCLDPFLSISAGTNSNFVPTIRTKRSWRKHEPFDEKRNTLAVDDNDLVLSLVVSILETAKFKVLQADGAARAAISFQ